MGVASMTSPSRTAGRSRVGTVNGSRYLSAQVGGHWHTTRAPISFEKRTVIADSTETRDTQIVDRHNQCSEVGVRPIFVSCFRGRTHTDTERYSEHAYQSGRPRVSRPSCFLALTDFGGYRVRGRSIMGNVSLACRLRFDSHLATRSASVGCSNIALGNTVCKGMGYPDDGRLDAHGEGQSNAVSTALRHWNGGGSVRNVMPRP